MSGTPAVLPLTTAGEGLHPVEPAKEKSMVKFIENKDINRKTYPAKICNISGKFTRVLNEMSKKNVGYDIIYIHEQGTHNTKYIVKFNGNPLDITKIELIWP